MIVRVTPALTKLVRPLEAQKFHCNGFEGKVLNSTRSFLRNNLILVY